MVSAMFATVLVLLSLTVVAAVVDSDRVIHVLQQAKRSLANGRWGLRPGKRSVALTDDLTCDARSIDGVRMELAVLLEKLLVRVTQCQAY
jgi:hypothetical protein